MCNCQERRVLVLQGRVRWLHEEGAAELNVEEWTGWAVWGRGLLELLSRAGEMVRPEF